MDKFLNGKTKSRNPNRVAIIGCEHVASTNIYSLLMNGAADEIVLIEAGNDRLLGALNNLRKAIPLGKPARIWAGDYSDAGDADIAVITAGIELLPNETKFARLKKNIAYTRRIIRRLMAANFDGIILMTINPVGLLAQMALQESNLPPRKVLGSGIAFDTERMREMFDPEDCLALSSIAGENRNVEIATWCAACGNHQPLVDFCDPNCPDFPAMRERVHNSATAPIERKAEMTTAVGSCVNRICEAILRDERAILPISAMTAGEYGISDVYLNLPCVVGRGGVESIIELPLKKTERGELNDTANLLKTMLGKLKTGAAYAAAS